MEGTSKHMDVKVLSLVVVGLLGGIAVGLQAPSANMIGSRIGVLESVFIVHLGGAIVAFVPLVMRGGVNLASWRGVPWYALAAGAYGLVVISALNFAIPKLGASATFMLMVTGQLLTGMILDQFGWFEVGVRPVDLWRVVGVIVMFAGAWLVIRPNG